MLNKTITANSIDKYAVIKSFLRMLATMLNNKINLYTPTTT